jgi:hypothetical protein
MCVTPGKSWPLPECGRWTGHRRCACKIGIFGNFAVTCWTIVNEDRASHHLSATSSKLINGLACKLLKKMGVLAIAELCGWVVDQLKSAMKGCGFQHWFRPVFAGNGTEHHTILHHDDETGFNACSDAETNPGRQPARSESGGLHVRATNSPAPFPSLMVTSDQFS